MSNVNIEFLLALIVIIIGFLLKTGNIISEENGKVIAKLVFNITLPSVIFSTIVSIEITPQLFLLAVIPIMYASVLFLITYIFLRNKELCVKGLSLMSVMGFNVAHLAFPLIQGIWGQEGLKYIAMFDVGNGFVIFLMSYLVGSFFSPKNDELEKQELVKVGFKNIATSGPLIAYFIALPLNLLGLYDPGFFIWGFISDIINKFANANSALTLLLLGIFLNFQFEKTEWKQIWRVLIFRYGFGLFVGLFLYFTLPFEQLYRGILVVALILPIGLAVIPFTVEFLFDEDVAGTMINLSIIISFVLMWILILVLGFG